MQSNEDISEELRLISTTVAGISRRVPYEVPAGYFDGLAGRVLGSIEDAGGSVDQPSDPELGKQNPYTLPEDYFASFAEKLLARIKAGQEGGAGEELSVISPLLHSIDKKTPLAAPEGYFGDLAGNILAGVQAIELVNDELENLSPLMTSLQPVAVYQVPEGYFDLFPGTILAAIKRLPAQEPSVAGEQAEPGRLADVMTTGSPARVISMGAIRRTKKWLRYSAAAVMTGLILTAGWLGLHHSGGGVVPEARNNIENNLAKASDQEIQNYLDNQNTSESEVLANNTATATLDINDADVKNILGDVSDDELTQYLDDNGGGKEPLTN